MSSRHMQHSPRVTDGREDSKRGGSWAEEGDTMEL